MRLKFMTAALCACFAVALQANVLVYKSAGQVKTFSKDSYDSEAGEYIKQNMKTYMVCEYDPLGGFGLPSILYCNKKSKIYSEATLFQGSAKFSNFQDDKREYLVVTGATGGMMTGRILKVKAAKVGYSQDINVPLKLNGTFTDYRACYAGSGTDTSRFLFINKAKSSYALDKKLSKIINAQGLSKSEAVTYIKEHELSGYDSSSVPSFVPQMANIDFVQDAITAYYDQGFHNADLSATADKAMEALKSYEGQSGKFAVVFDIDDTCVLTWPQIKDTDFAYSSYSWWTWAEENNFPAIEQSLELVNQAKEQGVTVIFITGRHEELNTVVTNPIDGTQTTVHFDCEEITEQNLTAAGYSGWAEIYYKPSDWTGTTLAYKTQTRKTLVEEEGYTIIFSVGDQWSDLGEYANHNFKYANPLYYIP